MEIFIDADGCPVKEEIYRVATRYQLNVFVVANQPMNTPADARVKMEVVPAGPDIADDWIVARVKKNDVVITADILLADRCIKLGARVIGTKGSEFTEDSIGSAVADRELMQTLRQFGDMRGGPAPMDRKDRSRFLGTLDAVIQSIKRQPK